MLLLESQAEMRVPALLLKENYQCLSSIIMLVSSYFAQDMHNLAFSAGYVQASDMIWQMERTRRAG